MRRAIERAKLGRDDRLAALRRLDDAARRLERTAGGKRMETIVAEELDHSRAYGGMTVRGRAARAPQMRHAQQLPLF